MPFEACGPSRNIATFVQQESKGGVYESRTRKNRKAASAIVLDDARGGSRADIVTCRQACFWTGGLRCDPGHGSGFIRTSSARRQSKDIEPDNAREPPRSHEPVGRLRVS